MLDRNFFQKISGSATENYIWVSNTILSFRKKLKIIFWENLWTDRRLDRWVDGRTDGRTDGQTLFYRPKTGVQKYNMTQENATVKNEIKRKKNGRKKKLDITIGISQYTEFMKYFIFICLGYDDLVHWTLTYYYTQKWKLFTNVLRSLGVKHRKLYSVKLF